MDTADFLWEKRCSSLPEGGQGFGGRKTAFADEGYAGFDALLDRALEKHIFGTKMRSVIRKKNEKGIADIVKQQFDVGKQIAAKGLVPILEPEVDIHAEDKAGIEEILKEEIKKELEKLPQDTLIMLKLTIPDVPDTYRELMDYPQMVRIVALSGGYSREEANEKLSENEGMIASFSRALTEGLHVDQSDEEFDQLLGAAVESIYQASL